MKWTDVHGRIFAQTFDKVLGPGRDGAMAFVRCLIPDVVAELAADASFVLEGWQVFRVADEERVKNRTVTAGRAVAMREAKGGPILLLVDTERAGAGMDGIYSAAREVDEGQLFREAQRSAGSEITKRSHAACRRYAMQAITKARRRGGRFVVSQWTEVDFLCRVAAGDKPPGAYLHLLGLWPILGDSSTDAEDNLNTSRMFVDRLLAPGAAHLPAATRIKVVRLKRGTETGDLERFLHWADTKLLLVALEELAKNEDLWIGNLRTEPQAQTIQSIDLTPWRNRRGTLAKWSGLVDGADANQPPEFILRPNAAQGGRLSTLEVRWKVDPSHLEKNAAEYRVVVETDQGEELASRQVRHGAWKGGEKCRFSDDDLPLEDDTLLSAKVAVEVVDRPDIERQESEEFVIRFGEPPKRPTGGIGTTVRAFSEGLSELGSRETVSEITSSNSPSVRFESKGFLLLRTPVEMGRRKTFRVVRPSLIAEVEKAWGDDGGQIGRWKVKVRGSGERAGAAQFEPLRGDGIKEWERVAVASRSFAGHCGAVGGVGQVYDDTVAGFRIVQEYLRAWAALLENGDPLFTLANTVEVQSQSGHTVGLIVLPAHPLRVAWHSAYDNLVLDAAFTQKQNARYIRDEFAALDGAMFPAFLPNPHGGVFVFADTLGFHAVGMVPDADKEPKAAVAILARALGDGEAADIAPSVGGQSAAILTDEIVKYLDCHNTSRLLLIHALRAGDGLTVARSLGGVHRRYTEGRETSDEDGDEDSAAPSPVFSLDLYPSDPSAKQRAVAGRFISEAREKRRSGAGVLAAEDRWMLDSVSLPGGVNLPRLRWARKERQDPNTAAHLAIAFDTFESRVVVGENERNRSSEPFHAFGLLSFYERHFNSLPTPVWISAIPSTSDGEKHPSGRGHTAILARIQDAVQHAVVRHIGSGEGKPALKTEISPEKAESLAELHRLCDWVVTLDRNAGVEYFDSPHDNPSIYDAYVIDCVPEREDLGCLQLITSTANLEEVRNLLDGALDQMGLSRSRRNAEFLLEHLKALSGRLAIRLTGHRPPTSELIALAMSHANCRQASVKDDCWVSLEDGFIVPVDEVRDLLPPLSGGDKDEDGQAARPDLIYVTLEPRRGLVFRFVEVKYRRHLRTARSLDVLDQIRRQTDRHRARWNRWYGQQDVCSAFRAIRRAKLARVLRFYADKAHRHCLAAERHRELIAEINRMIEKGGDYAFSIVNRGDRGWVFCPEYAGHRPLKISSDESDAQVFLFGPGLLPDSGFDSGVPDSEETEQTNPRSGAHPTKRPPRPDDETAARRKDEGVSTTVTPNASSSDEADVVPSMHLGTDTLTGTEVDWRLQVGGNPHLLIAGLPGMGKTTCLVNLCKQMVAADIRPVVFSYHQDIDGTLEEAIGDVRFVDFDGLGFNPLRVIDRQVRVAHLDVAGAMRDIFTAIYPELGEIQGDRIRKAIKDSFEETGWTSGETTAPEPAFKRFVEILRAESRPDHGLRTLLARLGELDDYGFFDIGDDSRGSLWDGERSTVIRIHTTQNDNLQRAFSYLVFYGLYKDMFRRGVQDRITHALIFDEAHRAARLKLIPTMAKECRKYGISLVLASQEARDFDVSIFSAIANYLVLRSTDADAKFLVRNVSNSKQERVLIDRIKQMPAFHALYFGENKSRPAHVALAP